MKTNHNFKYLFGDDVIESWNVGGEKSVESLVEGLSTGSAGVYHKTQCSVHVVVHKKEHLKYTECDDMISNVCATCTILNIRSNV